MSQRIYQNTLDAVILSLQQIFRDQLQADKVVPNVLKQNPKWGSRDRRFVAEHTYNLVRWWRKYWAILDKQPSTRREDLYLLFGVYWLSTNESLPPFPEFEKLIGYKPDLEKIAALPLEISESYPDWLHQRATEELGEDWTEIAKNLNLAAPLTLRTNTLKTTRDQLQLKLKEAGIETTVCPDSEIALTVDKRTNLINLNLYKSGLFEVQDLGSQDIGQFVNPVKGTKVVDACAGAGGKTLHMAQLMENTGKLIAMDVEKYKLQEMKVRLKRNGVKIVQEAFLQSENTIRLYFRQADKVLLDVPCSGTGVIKRQADTKWKLTETRLDELIEIQQNILIDYSKMVKPKGELIYATCSVMKSENEDQVKRFLAEQPNFAFVEEKRINPTALRDGFYMAKMIKETDE